MFQNLKTSSVTGNLIKQKKIKKEVQVPPLEIKETQAFSSREKTIPKTFRTRSSLQPSRTDSVKKTSEKKFIYNSNILANSPYFGLLRTNIDHKDQDKSEVNLRKIVGKKLVISNKKSIEELQDTYKKKLTNLLSANRVGIKKDDFSIIREEDKGRDNEGVQVCLP